MGGSKKDAIDGLLDFILADDTPVGPGDDENLALFRRATDDAEVRLGKARLQRAREGVFASSMKQSATKQSLENARKLYERAKAGDTAAGLTLAARYGDGSMDGDLDAILEDLAELDAEENEEN
jgi:hypothetical protein